jgi:hypothetical protein
MASRVMASRGYIYAAERARICTAWRKDFVRRRGVEGVREGRRTRIEEGVQEGGRAHWMECVRDSECVIGNTGGETYVCGHQDSALPRLAMPSTC